MLAFFGNFKTFETISVAKSTFQEAGLAGLAPAGSAGGGAQAVQPSAVADALIAEQRDAGSTIRFQLVSSAYRQLPGAAAAPPGGSAANGSSGGAVTQTAAASSPASGSGTAIASGSASGAYDVEYVVESCRGEIQEAKGGRLRCVGLNDTDLETVRRHTVMTAVLSPSEGIVYLAKGSAVEEKWGAVSSAVTAAVRTLTVGKAA